jgi:RHS repeat-associated protein
MVILDPTKGKPELNISSIDYGQGKWKIYTEPSDGVETVNNNDLYPPPGEPMWDSYRVTITSPLGNKEEYFYFGGDLDFGRSWYVSPQHYIKYTKKLNNSNAAKTEYKFGPLPNGGGMGVVSSTSRPAGDTQYFNYNPAGKLTQLNFGLGKAVAYYYAYNSLNHLLKLTEPNAHSVDYGYAANKEDLVSVTDGRGSQSLEYNATHDLTGITDRLGNKTTIEYNSFGQPTKTTDPQNVVTQYVYNSENRLVQLSRDGQIVLTRSYDIKGRVTSETGAEGLTLGYVYDDLDRLAQINYPDNKHTIIQWSKIRPWMIDQVSMRDGRTATFSHDAEQRLILDINSENSVAHYEYDKNGNLTRFVDNNSVATQWTYDKNDRVNKKTYSDGSHVIYNWNNRDRLSKWTNARNMAIAYSYDNNAKLTLIDYPPKNPDISFVYDSYSRVSQRTDALGVFTYSYDANDNLTKVDGPWANDVITYQYDSLNRRISMSVEGGQTVQYSYDSQGRQSGLNINGEAYSFGYDNANPLPKTLTRPNNSLTRYQRDGLLRTTQISNQTSSGTVINQHDHTYNGQDLKDSENIIFGTGYNLNAPGIKTYQNNTLNQVINANPPPLNYVYDADGNLTQGYTPQGYLFTAKYDAANRLQQLLYTDNNSVKRKIAYTYSGDGLVGQIDKYSGTVLTESTRLVRDGFLVVQELDALNGNAVKRQYVWQNQTQGGIGRLLALLQDGQRYDYFYDDNGNVMALLDNAQNIVAQYSYSPFGQLQTATGTLANQPMRFSTKYYDPETGLSDFGYRFYRADVGKWLNRDPIGERGGISLYNYVNDNPINTVDPLGLWTVNIGFSGSINIPMIGSVGIGGGGFGGIAIDGHGNIGWYWGGGGGIGAGAGGGAAGIQLGRSDADSICDLAGPFGSASGSGGEGVIVGGEVYTGSGSHGQTVTGGNLFIGGGGGTPVSGTIGGTNTWISPF